MSADLERVLEVFEEALERDPGQRRAFIEQEAGADESLRERVLEMLERDEQPDQRLDDLALSDRRAVLEGLLGHEHHARIPETIGAFRVLRRLGRGGMGDVFEVEQRSPRRRVALKLLRHGHQPGEQRRRFRRESELLARLDHPSIAKIHEVGETATGDGAMPFFVMELVDGADLRRWSEGRARRELLGAFVRICEAVDHAHQAGVVHRDLKPENVLVGADGIPKVLDFGVARVVDARLELTTMRTEAGQLIGTLAYMAPEQARGDTDAIDARTDVYALGVMLFELLAGHLPHRIQGRPVAEALRTISEDEPSSLATLDSSLRGDLDVIVAQALEKEPRRRYASAAAL
ncbi:MAG: serine/threonine-protein kinase, partial [Planctomycetota bacterium]